jgi:cyclic pyranopterin phosphate synthase
MVDVGHKRVTARHAIARAEVHMRPATLERIVAGGMPKGDVVAAARLAGIMAAKRTAELIPLCHPLPLDSVEVDVVPDEPGQCMRLEGRVRVRARTGAEMEALVAVSIAALTLYDMCKAIDREMVVGGVRLVHKAGGKRGTFTRRGEPV